MRHALPLAAALLTASAVPAVAQPLRATYEVHAAGMVVLTMEAEMEVTPGGYRLATLIRTRGIAAVFAPGEQMTRVAGAWQGPTATPASYVSEGAWRGRPRRTALDWRGGAPVVRDMVPPNAEEREEVPADLQRGTVDALSALAQLSRAIAATGRCDGQAAVFDGRRRSDYSSRTAGRELIRPWRDAWHGEALRCGFEARVVAGFRRDGSGDEGRPTPGTAWVAPPFAGAPPIPVRVEMPSRWFGAATAILLKAEPLGQQARAQGGAQ
jgi:hypothetical protein